MKIEVWSDYVCPYCYLGKQLLEEALDQFPHREHVVVEFKSFALPENAKTSFSETSISNTIKQSLKGHEHVNVTDPFKKELKKQLRTLNVMSNKKICTIKAHRLSKYAATKNKLTAIVDQLFLTHFVKKGQISNDETLLKIAEEIELDLRETAEVLATNRFNRSIVIDHEEAEEIGIDELPFFIFNEMYAVKGIQRREDFLTILYDVWEDVKHCQRYKDRIKVAKTSFCIGEDCE